VRLVAGPWITDFLDEAEAYPNSRFLDQIDAAAMAFAHLAKRAGYDLEIWQRAFG
jgi:phage terminase large subunit-like protein